MSGENGAAPPSGGGGGDSPVDTETVNLLARITRLQVSRPPKPLTPGEAQRDASYLCGRVNLIDICGRPIGSWLHLFTSLMHGESCWW